MFAYSQYNLALRKSNFYKNIESLSLHPENLKINKKSRDYPKDSVQLYYEEISDAYQEISPELNTSQKVYWLFEMASLQRILDELDAAINIHQKSLSLLHDKEDSRAYYIIKREMADDYRQEGLKERSNELFLEILEIPLVKDDIKEQMYVNSMVSENYENLLEDEKAMELSIILYHYHLKESQLADASYNLVQMGRIASNLESDTSFFEYFHMANELASKSGRLPRVINNLVNTGMMYNQVGYNLEGLKYLKRAERLEKDKAINNWYLLTGLCEAYMSLDSLQQAYYYLKKNLELSKTSDRYGSIYSATMQLLSYYEKVENIDSARILLNEAIKLNKKIGKKSFNHQLYKHLSILSTQLGDYPAALAYLDTSYQEYNKLTQRTNIDKLAGLRIKSDYSVHRNRIAQLVAKNKLEQEKRRRLLIIFIVVLLVLVIITYFTIVIRMRLKQLRESYVSLVEKNIELDRLNKRLQGCEISHLKKVKPESISGEQLIIKKLSMMIYEEEIYMDNHLSLKNLADKLNTNTSYLSAIINSHYKCNFRTFINKHRIDKARAMLVSNEFKHYSMEGIASEVGFTSRSSFYQAFKSVTGLSPSLYIENYHLIVQKGSHLA
jgi:AraC-like DNA-binding protein